MSSKIQTEQQAGGGPHPFDSQRARHLRVRAQKNFSDYSFVSDVIAEQLSDRLLDIKKDLKKIVVTGAGRLTPDQLARLARNAGSQQIYTTDPIQGDVLGDEELLPFGRNTLDGLISHLGLHILNDLPGALIQINYALKPDGVFLGALFGGETLYELRQVLMETEMQLKGGVSPRVYPFADKQQMGALLQRAGFALPVVDSDIIKISYEDISRLLHDIKGMGEGNVLTQRSRSYAGREFFENAQEIYQDKFCDEDGRLTASFEIIYLIGWAPHQSQQQPLRPGSAEKSMADALETKERSTGVSVKE